MLSRSFVLISLFVFVLASAHQQASANATRPPLIVPPTDQVKDGVLLSEGRSAAIGFQGTQNRFLVVLRDESTQLLSVAPIGTDGSTIGTPQVISDEPGACPAIEKNVGEQLVLAWVSGSDIRMRVLNVDGSSAGPELVLDSSNRPASVPGCPSLSRNVYNGQYLVTWVNSNVVRGQIVDTSDASNPLIEGPFEISEMVDPSSFTAAAFDPVTSHFLVVYRKRTLLGQLVSVRGTLVGSAFQISSRTSDSIPASALSFSSEPSEGGFLVVWEEQAPAGPLPEVSTFGARIVGQRMNVMVDAMDEGTLSLHGSVIEIAGTTAGPSDARGPVDVVYSPVLREALVVWHNTLTDQVTGRKINSDNTTPGAPFDISVEPITHESRSNPRVAWSQPLAPLADSGSVRPNRMAFLALWRGNGGELRYRFVDPHLDVDGDGLLDSRAGANASEPARTGLGIKIPPPEEDPSYLWWASDGGACSDTYWANVCSPTECLPNPWVAGSRIGMQSAVLEANIDFCKLMWQRGWWPYNRYLQEGDGAPYAHLLSGVPSRMVTGTPYFAFYHPASGRLRTFQFVSKDDGHYSHLSYHVAITEGNQTPFADDGHLLLETAGVSSAYSQKQYAKGGDHTYTFGQASTKVWLVYDHQLSYDLTQWNDEKALYLWAHLQGEDVQLVTLEGVLSGTSTFPRDDEGSPLSPLGVLSSSELNPVKAAYRGYTSGQEAVKMIRKAGVILAAKHDENWEFYGQAILKMVDKLPLDTLVPGAGAVLGGISAINSLTSLWSKSDPPTQVSFSTELLNANGKINGTKGLGQLLIPLSTSLDTEIPYYAKLRPTARALGLYTLEVPPTVQVFWTRPIVEPYPRFYNPCKHGDWFWCIGTGILTMTDPACAVAINPIANAKLVERKTMAFLSDDKKVLDLSGRWPWFPETDPFSYPGMVVGWEVGDPNAPFPWVQTQDRIQIRVYLRFLLADGSQAEFLRTYKPEIYPLGLACPPPPFPGPGPGVETGAGPECGWPPPPEYPVCTSAKPFDNLVRYLPVLL